MTAIALRRETSSLPGIAPGTAAIGALALRLSPGLADVERRLRETVRVGRRVGRCVDQMLLRPGKRIRPMCVLLAAELGRGKSEATLALAAAAELVHGATLLHDDVIDEGEQRRGAPAARMLEGNAASVLAGDWLLTTALCQVRATAVDGALDDLLAVLQALVAAEALQLDGRGNLDPDVATYERIVDGKTASLFRFCLGAGARAGGVDDRARRALEAFGARLGRVFQLTDDLLDYGGDPAATGKALYEDLRQGKATYPLILALERDPALRATIEHALQDGMTDWRAIGADVRRRIDRAGALHDARARAAEVTRDAVAELEHVPDGPTRRALAAVAETIGARASAGR
ncbi:MAG: polyprenyl synthetase family protein [Acidobacteriota bacterium]